MLCFLLCFPVFSQDEAEPFCEIFIRNKTNVSIFAKFYPISSVFQGKPNSSSIPKFSLKSHVGVNRIGPISDPNLEYLVGLDGYALQNRGTQPGYFEIKPFGSGLYSVLNIDHNSSASEKADVLIGYGIYKLELFTYDSEFFTPLNNSPIIFDYRDLNYSSLNGYGSNLSVDLSIYINSTNSGGITYQWYQGPTSDEINLNSIPIQDRNIFKCYYQYHRFENNQWFIRSVTPNFNTYGITKSDELLFPIDGTYLNDLDYRIPRHDNPGLLVSPLEVSNNHIVNIKCGKTFSVDNSAKMTLTSDVNGNNYSQVLVGDFTTTNCGATFRILGNPNQTPGNYAWLYMMQNCTLIVNKNSDLILERNSLVTMLNGSKIIVKEGGYYCNYGARFGGSGGEIILSKRVYSSHCVLDNINEIYNGTKLILEDSAIYVIPDSSTITFDSTSKLIMNPHSELRFGKNSKLKFERGSSISCDNAKFTSLDSTQTWDGIYLDGIAYDTLKNCTFQNALNGINLTDNYDPFGSPGAVEISNCTFKNSTDAELLNYVYVNNSSNVLVKGCNAVKTGSAGFTAGIIAEYCPAGGIVICDNNINYVNTGISLLQSSEYIARNVITGYSNTGTGIYLDNSNGTIEYNTVNNFQKSVFGSYSSPYLLKNTLIDAYITNIDLVNSSMPVMKPVISLATLRWLGGNNTITGYPTNSGIRFADCYPLIDSGYNKIIVNGSDYLNGNFTFLYTEVPARINDWYDNPPNSSLFDISGGYADYSNPFNGSSLPATDGTELNSIGWGLYDTVFSKTMGDNPTPEDLFTQAYMEEMSGNYIDAVTHYKEVVSSYKTSEYAPVALARIFNCLEKSRASISQFYAIQGYYTNIQNNSSYPNATRELSEDFKIKSKVKQFNVEEAITDYETIYQNNQNNAKGIHALINKLSLQRMTSGDAPNGSMINYTEHKLGILSLITGKDLKNTGNITNNQPNHFRLHQNYPNPFNPTTSIRFDVPLLRGVSEGRGVFISLKVYDILGKEVFSLTEYKLAGSYEVKFDGSNLASGMYFYTFDANGYKDVKKMVLLK